MWLTTGLAPGLAILVLVGVNRHGAAPPCASLNRTLVSRSAPLANESTCVRLNPRWNGWLHLFATLSLRRCVALDTGAARVLAPLWSDLGRRRHGVCQVSALGAPWKLQRHTGQCKHTTIQLAAMHAHGCRCWRHLSNGAVGFLVLALLVFTADGRGCRDFVVRLGVRGALGENHA